MVVAETSLSNRYFTSVFFVDLNDFSEDNEIFDVNDEINESESVKTNKWKNSDEPVEIYLDFWSQTAFVFAIIIIIGRSKFDRWIT